MRSLQLKVSLPIPSITSYVGRACLTEDGGLVEVRAEANYCGHPKRLQSVLITVEPVCASEFDWPLPVTFRVPPASIVCVQPEKKEESNGGSRCKRSSSPSLARKEDEEKKKADKLLDVCVDSDTTTAGPSSPSDSEGSRETPQDDPKAEATPAQPSFRGYKNPHLGEMRLTVPRFHQTLSLCRKRILQSFLAQRAPQDKSRAPARVGCRLCDSRLLFKGSSMLQHVYKHSAYKLFRCAHCDFSAHFSFMAIQHTRGRHPGVDPYAFVDCRPQHDETLAALALQCYSPDGPTLFSPTH